MKIGGSGSDVIIAARRLALIITGKTFMSFHSSPTTSLIRFVEMLSLIEHLRLGCFIV